MARLTAFFALVLLAACGDAMGAPPYDVVIVGDATAIDEEQLAIAVKRWNEPVGGGLLVYRGKVGRPADGRVNVFLNADQALNNGKCIRRNPGLDSVGDVVRLDIHAGPAEDGTFLRVVLMHELGHALGLEHEKDPASVMYSPAGTDQLSAADVARVRKLWSLEPTDAATF